MAWRIHDSVQRGEIDNRERGVVRGRIWLCGLNEPVTLELNGNACSDLAGCLLRFENPGQIVPMRPDARFNLLQRGTIGDLTASRQVRVFDLPFEDASRRLKKKLPVPEWLEGGQQIAAVLERHTSLLQALADANSPDARRVIITYKDIHSGKKVADDERSIIKAHLKISGVANRQAGNLVTRNRIYERAFDSRWIKENTPSAVPRRIMIGSTLVVVLALIIAAYFAYQEYTRTDEERAARFESNFNVTNDPRVAEDPEAGEVMGDSFQLVSILDEGSVRLPAYGSLVIFMLYGGFHLWGLHRAEQRKLSPILS